MAADFLNLSNWNNSSTNQLPQSLLCCTWIQSKFMNLQALLWSLNISEMWIVIGDSWLFRVTFNVIALLRNNNLKGYINSKPDQSPTEISIIFLLHRWRNEGSERFRDLLKIPQQLGNHAEVQAKSLWLHILTAPHHPVLILCIPGICPTILQIFTQGLPCVRHCVGITVYLVIQDRKFHISLTPPLAPPCTSVWILSSRDFILMYFSTLFLRLYTPHYWLIHLFSGTTQCCILATPILMSSHLFFLSMYPSYYQWLILLICMSLPYMTNLKGSLFL